MAEHVLMTALSPTMEEGSIVSWNKKEGDAVAPGDILCEVETDKATMDYESTQEGTLLKILLGDGSSAKVGKPIAIIGEAGEDVSELESAASAPAAAAPASAESADEPAPASDAAAPAAAPETAGGEATPPATATPVKGSGPVKASPLARRLASERGVDIASIPGSGPEGRVVRRDVENFVPRPGFAAASAAGAIGVAGPGADLQVPVSGVRGVIAKRLAESKFSAPHYYLKSTVRMDATMAARSALNRELPEKVGFNAFLIKFVAEALKRHPGVNASWQGDHILQFGSIDIGLAVDQGKGLITPIVRNCGNRGVVDIDRELKVLISKAAEGTLQPDEYTGATFTISNLGSFGVEEFTAIINPPGSAILAVGEIAKTVFVDDNDELDVARVMKMTLSCDHRVIDGAAGGRFIHDLKRVIEAPVRALY